MTGTYYLAKEDRMKESLHFKELVSTVAESPFVLFVGAGINGKMGMLWNDLLHYLRGYAYAFIQKECKEEAFTEYCNSLSVETQAELYKLILGSQYTLFLKKAIYAPPLPYDRFSYHTLAKYVRDAEKPPKDIEKQADDMHDKYQYLYHIGQLSQHPSVAAILTLNYDNFLEMTIHHLNHGKPKRRPHSIPGGRTWGSPDTTSFVPVYHIHGFLPYPTPEMPAESENIVLSQDEYITTIQDPSGIANNTAIFHLTNYPALFLGLSMKDWNILRYLRASLDNGRSFSHFCIDAQDESTGSLKSTLMHAYNVKMILFSKNDYSSVRAAVKKIHNQLEEK